MQLGFMDIGVSPYFVVVLQILRPYQLATVIVLAHPWVPHTGPLLDLVAQAEGEPKAEVLMGVDPSLGSSGAGRLPGARGIGSWTLEWTGTFASSLTSGPDGTASSDAVIMSVSLYVNDHVTTLCVSCNCYTPSCALFATRMCGTGGFADAADIVTT